MWWDGIAALALAGEIAASRYTASDPTRAVSLSARCATAEHVAQVAPQREGKRVVPPRFPLQVLNVGVNAPAASLQLVLALAQEAAQAVQLRGGRGGISVRRLCPCSPPRPAAPLPPTSRMALSRRFSSMSSMARCTRRDKLSSVRCSHSRSRRSRASSRWSCAGAGAGVGGFDTLKSAYTAHWRGKRRGTHNGDVRSSD